jgi:hypothetical protein
LSCWVTLGLRRRRAGIGCGHPRPPRFAGLLAAIFLCQHSEGPLETKASTSYAPSTMPIENQVYRSITNQGALNHLLDNLGPQQKAVAVLVGDRQWCIRVVDAPKPSFA